MAYFDCTATWADRAERHHAWDVCRRCPTPGRVRSRDHLARRTRLPRRRGAAARPVPRAGGPRRGPRHRRAPARPGGRNFAGCCSRPGSGPSSPTGPSPSRSGGGSAPGGRRAPLPHRAPDRRAHDDRGRRRARGRSRIDHQRRRRRAPASPTPRHWSASCGAIRTSPSTASRSTWSTSPIRARCWPPPMTLPTPTARRSSGASTGSTGRARHGPWTRAVLESIAARPATRAADLAEQLRARDAAVQDRRAQAQEPRAHREPRGRLPALPPRRGVPRDDVGSRGPTARRPTDAARRAVKLAESF